MDSASSICWATQVERVARRAGLAGRALAAPLPPLRRPPGRNSRRRSRQRPGASRHHAADTSSLPRHSDLHQLVRREEQLRPRLRPRQPSSHCSTSSFQSAATSNSCAPERQQARQTPPNPSAPAPPLALRTGRRTRIKPLFCLESRAASDRRQRRRRAARHRTRTESVRYAGNHAGEMPRRAR